MCSYHKPTIEDHVLNRTFSLNRTVRTEGGLYLELRREGEGANVIQFQFTSYHLSIAMKTVLCETTYLSTILSFASLLMHFLTAMASGHLGDRLLR